MFAAILIVVLAVITLVSYELCLGSLSRARVREEDTLREVVEAPPVE